MGDTSPLRVLSWSRGRPPAGSAERRSFDGPVTTPPQFRQRWRTAIPGNRTVAVGMTAAGLSESLRRRAPIVAPSMLKVDFGNLAREIQLLDQAQTSVLHWDVMDGVFVPNLSYGAMVIKSCRSRTDQLFEAHLMVSDPGP